MVSQHPTALTGEPAGRSYGPAGIIRLLRSRDATAISELLERVARLIVTATVFLVAVIFDPRTADAFNLIKITTVWVLGLLAFGMWWLSVYIGQKRVVPRSRIFRIAFVLLGVTTLATLFSSNRTLSFFGLYHRYDGLASLVLYVGIAGLVAVLYWHRPDALREIAVAIGTAAAVVGIYVLVQRLHADPIPWRINGRVPPFPLGNLGNSEFTASFLGLTAPFVAYLAVSARSVRRRIGWVVAGMLALIGLWATQGRSGALAAAVGVLALFLFASKVRPVRKVAIVVITLFFLAVATVAISRGSRPTESGWLRTASVQYRSELWGDAWRQIRKKPVLGWGPEAFYGNYALFRSGLDARSQGPVIPEAPHNIYLSRAVSTGSAGLLTYAFLIGAAALIVAKRAPRLSRSRRLLVATFGAGFVAYLVQGLFSIDIPPLAYTGWVILAAIAVLADSPAAGAHEPAVELETLPPASVLQYAGTSATDTSSPWRLLVRVAAPVGVCAGLLFLVVAGLAPYRADHLVWVAERSPSRWSADTMEWYEKAARLNPHEAAYRAMEAGYLERIADDPNSAFTAASALERAASLYEKAVSMQPRNEQYVLGAARVFERLARYVHATYYPSADKWWGRAVAVDPLNPRIHRVYADMLGRWWLVEARSDRTSDILRRAGEQTAAADRLERGPKVAQQ